MNFPVYVNLFGFRVHPHLVFEILAYSIGFRVFLRIRRNSRAIKIPLEPATWIVLGCLFGAWFGSKLLSWLETPQVYWQFRTNPIVWLNGKTIVGGFIGGWIGVELAKKLVGVRQATGDLYVFPIILGTCIGRVGCFLSGLQDDTYGIATSLPWGIDFGDGIRRHPAQLYEILFMLALGGWLWWRSRTPCPNGLLFRMLMLGYFGFRFAVEFIKPTTFSYLGLTAIQLASLAAFIYCAIQIFSYPTSAETVSVNESEAES